MKKLLTGCFVFLIITGTFTYRAYAENIELKDWHWIKGEANSIDDFHLSKKYLKFFSLDLHRNKIINILPEFITSRQRVSDSSDLPKRNKKKLISIYLSGGLSNIDGGDLNGAIRGWDEAYNDYNDYFTNASFTVDWDEIKWIPNFCGEILFNLSNFLSFSIGIEYISNKDIKYFADKNRGSLTYDYTESGTVLDLGFYYDWLYEANESWEPEYKLTVMPVTFNIYLFLPTGRKAEFFIKAGVGYYLGKLEYNEPYLYEEAYQEDYYDLSDTYMNSWLDEYSYEGAYFYEGKCNAIGFHGGIGYDIKFSPNFSLIIEGNYRYVNFNNWEGSGSDEWSWDKEYGWSNLILTTESGNESDSWEGKIWCWEYADSDTGKQYKRIFLLREQPEANGVIKNVRGAEFNLNGFSLRVGFKITI